MQPLIGTFQASSVHWWPSPTSGDRAVQITDPQLRKRLQQIVAVQMALDRLSAAGSGPAGVPAGEGGVAIAPAGV